MKNTGLANSASILPAEEGQNKRILTLISKKNKKSKTRLTKVGFIAGPYFGDGTYDVIERNITDAEGVAIELANRGIFFFCPHTHTRHFEAKSKAPEAFYKAMDIHHLNGCDFLIALPRWRESSGARKEVEVFISIGKPIFYLSSLGDVDTFNKIERYAKKGSK